MSDVASQQTLIPPACELRARVTSLPTLRMNRADHVAIIADIEALIARAPGMLKGASVALEPVDFGADEIDLAALVAALRDSGVFPAAVCSDDPAWRAGAEQAGLGLLATAQPTEKPKPTPEQKAQAQTMLIEKPVRSGQQLYARDADMVVIGPVGAGAEVIADGNIHIYGPLRGRAIAGAAGNDQARIFCRQMDAELVAVAGCYSTNEQLPDAVRGGGAQVRLASDQLKIESFN